MARWWFDLMDRWRNLWVRLGNARRRFSRRPLARIYMQITGSLPEFVAPLPWWRRLLPLPGVSPGEPPLSMVELRSRFERLAQDPRTRTIVLQLDGLAVGWATAQSLRRAIARLRGAGKRVVAYAEDFDGSNYFIALAADDVIAAPIAGWNFVGLRLELLFVKDALKDWGIEADVIAVSPYKTGGDALSRSDLSPEQRENLDWILDYQFEALVAEIAESRGLTSEGVRVLVDQAPYTAEEALMAGLFDRLMYLDELSQFLEHEETGLEAQASRRSRRLVPWSRAERVVYRRRRRRSGKGIAVVPVEGLIVRGQSRRLPLPFPLPFFDNRQAGAATIAQALRRIEKDQRIAALVLYVDSRGGSGFGSQLIYRELERLHRRIPVVVCMVNYAASGGYYVSCDADWIVAQPFTVTGSIGVYTRRLNLDGFFDLFNVNRVSLERGDRAGLFSDTGSLEEDHREVLAKFVFTEYDRFKDIVVRGRGIMPADLEPIAGGRVWLGDQALAHGLVDQFGDLQDALEKAQELAGLPEDRWTPAFWLVGGEGGLLPAPFPQVDRETWDPLGGLERERVWLMAPFELRIR